MKYAGNLGLKKLLLLLVIAALIVAAGFIIWNNHKNNDIHRHETSVPLQAATFYQGTTRREFIVNFYNYYLNYHNDKVSVASLIQNHSTPKFSNLYAKNKGTTAEPLLCGGSSNLLAGVIIDNEQSEPPATRFTLAFTDSKGLKSAGGPQIVVVQQGGKFMVDGVACAQHGETDHLTNTPPVKH